MSTNCKKKLTDFSISFYMLYYVNGHISESNLINRTGLCANCASNILKDTLKKYMTNGETQSDAIKFIIEQHKKEEQEIQRRLENDIANKNFKVINNKEELISQLENFLTISNKSQEKSRIFVLENNERITQVIMALDEDEIIRIFPKKNDLLAVGRVIILHDFGEVRQKKNKGQMLHYHILIRAKALNRVYLELEFSEKVVMD